MVSGVGLWSRGVSGSKVAKVANFWGSGFGDLAGQKLITRMTRPGPDRASPADLSTFSRKLHSWYSKPTLPHATA